MRYKICTRPDCNYANQLQPIINFGRDKTKSDGYSSWCKSCRKRQRDSKGKEYQRLKKQESRKKEINKLKENELQKVYNQRRAINNYQSYKIWCKKFAKFDIFADQIKLVEDFRRDPNDNQLIQVRCSLCNNWFNPTNLQIQNRSRLINGLKSGSDTRFYCSEQCKQNCSIYNQKKYPKGYIKKSSVRIDQPDLRNLVLERDNYICQICGETELELICHHIEPVSQNYIESADLDNCITLCKKCDRHVHSLPGCTYQELKIKC